ncbi:MAG TPA: protein kinase, partial [Candidatus Polarisedimenticolia bacterium]|nr:protein kinase [Candidatus Polarisedimenticolia bacterium]
MPLEPGQTIAHYRIERKIGEGGMGIVYLAEDTRLGRRVALKVLPPELSGDSERRARFEREARAIAALNHPNIVTIHSVEDADGISLLTMELVDGQRLTQLLSRDGMELGKLLEWSLGIADALVAAHRQGVVHRDLKPDNIMVTGDGRIKVLDFGLAKLRESVQEGYGTTLPTASITQEGRILGTVSYMSPEQAEGKPLDHRSDIFTFGVVLYEMATGRRPFRGDTPISTISSILKDTPPPPHQINTSLPAQLGRIVRRCLAKEPERRYQSTDDLRNELRELKEESESGGLTLELAPGAAPSAGRSGGSAFLKRPAVMGLAALLVALAGFAGWMWRRGAAMDAPALAPQGPIQMSRATTDGKVQEAAISPDGRYVAYVRRDGGVFSLRLRQLVTGDEVQVVAPSEAALTSPSFSADGDFLHYVSIDPGKPTGWVYRVSVLGGTPRRLVDGVSGVTASRDGSRLALTGGTVDQSYVRIVGPDGDNPRDLAIRKGRDHFDSNAAWSSDGSSLAIVSHRFGEPQQIVLIDPATGVEQPLPLPSLRSFSDLSWVPGKRALIVAGSERPANQGASSQIWEISTTGEKRPLTHDLNSYAQLTMTSDGSTVAAVQEERRFGIEVARVRDGAPEAFTEVFPISASRAGSGGIAWLDGNRLAHGMMQADAQQIFVTDVTTKSSRALTTGPSHRTPAVSRNGRAMVVARDD